MGFGIWLFNGTASAADLRACIASIEIDPEMRVGILLEVIMNSTQTLVRIAGYLSKIRTELLPSTNTEHYSRANITTI